MSTRTAPRTSAPRPRGRANTTRRVLGWLALDSSHAARDLLVGFGLGGLGVTLNVGIYAAGGWYHVDSVHFDPWPFLVSGLLGYLVLTALPEELLFRGVVFRAVERGLGTIAALVVCSLLFGAVHLANPHASFVGALGTAVSGGVMLSAAYLLTRNLWLAIGVHWAADFWQGAFFGLHPTGTTFSHPLLHATLHGPTVWTGDQYGGGLIGLAIVGPAATVLLWLAARRRHIQHLPRRSVPVR